MAWLDDHPPRHQQFRCPRRERPSGVIGVHTAESFPDETGPDTGAENVADFIRRRTSYGSYHDLVDSDSIINLVRYSCVAYHIATFSMNEHSYGVSAATQAHKWNQLGDDWVDATVRNMARASARYARWIKQHHGITIPARRITLAQARRKEPGFIAHGDADPDRRTDPGASFPWNTFLGYYAAEMNGDDDMPLTDADKEWLWKNIGPNADVVHSPKWEGEDNPHWTTERYLKEMRERLTKTALSDSVWHYQSDNKGEGPAAPPSYVATHPDNTHWYGERYLQEIWEMLHALMQAHQGMDGGSILDAIDAAAAAAEARDMAAQTERAEILVLVQQVGTGELSADEFVDAVARRLSGNQPTDTDA